jgi:hypothetical protein
LPQKQFKADDGGSNVGNEYDDDDDDDEFSVEVRPVNYQEHSKGYRQQKAGLQSFRSPFKNPLFRTKPKIFRPKQKYFGSGNQRATQSNGPTGPRPRPVQGGPPRREQEFFQHPRNDEASNPVLRRPPVDGRSTTPRPIPTPGPEDFPPPPPTRPTVPPTIPTHPPLITHPPSHYLPSHIPGNNLGSKIVDDDYDVSDKNYNDDDDKGPVFLTLFRL